MSAAVSDRLGSADGGAAAGAAGFAGAAAAAGAAGCACAAAAPVRSVRMTGTFAHPIADLCLEVLHHAPERRRHFHRGLVGFEGDQRLLRLDRVAGLDHDLDDRHVLEVADVRHPNLRDPRRCAGRRRRRGDGRLCRLRGASAPVELEREDRHALAHPVTELHRNGLHDAGRWGGDLHRGLVELQRNQRRLDRDAIARLHLDFDDRDILEVADVGNEDLPGFTHRSAPRVRAVAKRDAASLFRATVSVFRHMVQGGGRSGSIP